MDDAFVWRLPRIGRTKEAPQPKTSTTARFGDDGDEPVLIGIVHGPIEIEMAKDALAEAGIPAYVKQNSLGPIYGLSFGAFGAAEVWTVPAVAEQAQTLLHEIGLLAPEPGSSEEPEEAEGGR